MTLELIVFVSFAIFASVVIFRHFLLFVPMFFSFGLVFVLSLQLIYFIAGGTGLAADAVRAPKIACFALVLSVLLAAISGGVFGEPSAFIYRVALFVPIVWATASTTMHLASKSQKKIGLSKSDQAPQ